MNITIEEKKRLLHLLVDHELTQAGLARKLKVNRSIITRLLNGEYPLINLKKRIADYFNVPYEQLWNNTSAR